jgi:hypothetical protein
MFFLLLLFLKLKLIKKVDYFKLLFTYFLANSRTFQFPDIRAIFLNISYYTGSIFSKFLLIYDLIDVHVLSM